MTTLADRTIHIDPATDRALDAGAIEELKADLSEHWAVVNHKELRARFEFSDFATALAFTNAVGALAEAVQHHPDCLVGWGKVEITLWTHDIGGLHLADFILAARIDRIQRA